MADEITESYSCAKIIEEGILFEVPIYQRLFVWGEEQIEKLLSDVKEALKKHLPRYYIGVVTIKRPNDEKEIDDVWELVDGQQRNTFLTLFAAECVRMGNEQWIEFVFTDKNRSTLRIGYNGRQEDERDIVALAKGAVEEIGNKNFLVFHRVFYRWVESLKAEVGVWDAVESYFFNNVAFFVSELPRKYKPRELNLYFERMNAAGQQLGLLDVVKGRFFPKYSARIDAALHFGEKKFQTIAIGENDSKTLRDILDDQSGPTSAEDKADAVTIMSVISPELMMLHALSSVRGLLPKEVLSDERRIVSLFEDYFSDEKDCHDVLAETFLDELEKYRQWIDNNLVYVDLESDERVYRFRSIDADPNDDQHNEEAKLCSDEKDDIPNAVERLRQFESMLYVSHPNGEAWAYSAYCYFRNRDKISKSELLAFLMKWDHDYEKLPDLCELNYAHIERRWFWRLDYLLWDRIAFLSCNDVAPAWMPPRLLADDVCKIAIRKYIFRSNRSIEHLHPQTATDASETERSQWNKPLYENNCLKAEDSFGNLAMISSSFNSQQSNDQINVKLARIKDQIRENRIESIKMVVMSALTVGNDIRNWTVSIAKDHGEMMYELLQSAYGGSCVEAGQQAR